MRKYFDWKGNTISYYVFGTGTKIAFGLHGYSLSGHTFEGLGHVLSDAMTLYALDLPLHGDTIWQKDILLPAELRKILHAILLKEGHEESSKYTLFAHSMGGRIALQYVQNYMEEIALLVLMAPDGLKVSKWYSFGVNTAVGRFLFSRMSYSASAFLKFCRLMRRFGIINNSLYKLIESSIGQKTEAELVYKRAFMFRQFIPDSGLIGRMLRHAKKDAHIFFGKYDKIVRPSVARDMCENGKQFVHVHYLQCGHMILAASAEWQHIRSIVLGE